MTDERWKQLMDNPDEAVLTEEEITQGWHFCYSEWDGLLVGPGMAENEMCTCQ